MESGWYTAYYYLAAKRVVQIVLHMNELEKDSVKWKKSDTKGLEYCLTLHRQIRDRKISNCPSQSGGRRQDGADY